MANSGIFVPLNGCERDEAVQLSLGLLSLYSKKKMLPPSPESVESLILQFFRLVVQDCATFVFLGLSGRGDIKNHATSDHASEF
jgi:hypothetical protein